jgi:hypothetical protein
VADPGPAKQILIEIFRVSDAPRLSAAHLHRAFFLAHLFYAKANPAHLSDWPIVKGDRGPELAGADALLRQLETQGVLQRHAAHVGPFSTSLFQLRTDEFTGLEDRQIASVRQAVQFMADYGDAELDQLISSQSRCLRLAEPGQELDLYLDLIPEEEYVRREADLRDLASVLAGPVSSAKE